MLPQVDELRAQRRCASSARATGAATGSSPRCWWSSRAASRCCCPTSPARQKVDIASLQLPAGPTDAEQAAAEKRAEEFATQHTELEQTRARARLARRRAVGRRRISPPRANRSTRSAACSSAASTTTRAAPHGGAREGARRNRERACPRRWPRRLTEGKRALAAGEFENSRQAFDTALKIDPGNKEATEWLGKVAAASGVVPTLADAENAESRQGPAEGADAVRRRAQAQSRATSRPPKGLARVKQAMSDNAVQRRDGRGPGRAQRRPPGRGAHPPRKARAPCGPTAPKSARRCNASADTGSGRSIAELEQRAAAPGERGTLDRGAGHLRRGAGARSVAGVRAARAARRWRRARNSATGCRHS